MFPFNNRVKRLVLFETYMRVEITLFFILKHSLAVLGLGCGCLQGGIKPFLVFNSQAPGMPRYESTT